MAVLHERYVWRRSLPPGRSRKSTGLTLDQQANVARALRYLRKQAGSWSKLSAAMGILHDTVRRATLPGRGVSAGLALRAARVAGVDVEQVLDGRFPPPPIVCPHCGRSD